VTICFLDPEDEITGAVARIRAVTDTEVILVLPPGSRIATSRINFRLLEREAAVKGLNLVAVSDEPGVRALAISAGVAAYDSVVAAEGGLAEFARQEERLAARTGRQPVRRGGTGRAAGAAAGAGTTVGADAPAGADATGGANAAPEVVGPPGSRLPDEVTHGLADSARRRREGTRVMALPRGLPEEETGVHEAGYAAALTRSRRRRRRSALVPLLAILLAVTLVGLAAYGAYVFVPTATIELRPHLAAVGPISVGVIADPRVAVVDPGERIVPAQELRLPLSVEAEFPTTGSQVTTVRATGEVRFRSTNTINAIDVPANTRVSTSQGVDFETTAAVTVPRADFDSQTPGVADAPIRARRAGTAGNVPADSITALPQGLAGQQLSVNNPRATSGGARLVASVVARDDYDAALETLAGQLDTALAEALEDPALAPAGLTVYPASAVLGGTSPSAPAAEVVGTVTESFELALSAAATVLAVDERHVDEVALEHLRALVPAGATLLAGSLTVSHGPGEVADGLITFAASADGSAYRLPDRDELLAEVRGKSVAEARAIMEQYGSVALSVWPEFVDRVPDQPARINLTILPPTEAP
jgi:hypothetical protein